MDAVNMREKTNWQQSVPASDRTMVIKKMGNDRSNRGGGGVRPRWGLETK